MTPLHLPGLLARVPGDIAFRPFREGVEIAPLQEPGVDGAALALLRYRPGASVPMHEHTGLEVICVLQGSQSDERGTYRAGDVAVNPAGTRHSVRSDEGCTVLISWAAPVRILEDD